MRAIVYISRILVGLLFLFSGFVKSVDPMGGAIKFNEYFIAFSMEWLSPFATILSILLATIEMVVGAALIIGIYKKLTSWITALVMLFFTILTLILYFTNPVADCGCFGDAVVMTHGETLVKNIITMIIIIPFFIDAQRYKWFHSDKNKLIVLSIVLTVSLFAPFYAVCYLPLVDFLPYKVGVDIFKAMEIPKGAEKDVYETTLVYEDLKNGENVEFSVEDTTWYDQSRWKYVDTKTKLIKKGYTPPISSFNIFDGDHRDVTRDLLLSNDTIAAVVINKQFVSHGRERNIKDMIDSSNNQSVRFIYLTPFAGQEIANELNIHITDIYNADETVLKSLMRAPVGVIYFYKGVILSKRNLKYAR